MLHQLNNPHCSDACTSFLLYCVCHTQVVTTDPMLRLGLSAVLTKPRRAARCTRQSQNRSALQMSALGRPLEWIAPLSVKARCVPACDRPGDSDRQADHRECRRDSRWMMTRECQRVDLFDITQQSTSKYQTARTKTHTTRRCTQCHVYHEPREWTTGVPLRPFCRSATIRPEWT